MVLPKEQGLRPTAVDNTRVFPSFISQSGTSKRTRIETAHACFIACDKVKRQSGTSKRTRIETNDAKIIITIAMIVVRVVLPKEQGLRQSIAQVSPTFIICQSGTSKRTRIETVGRMSIRPPPQLGQSGTSKRTRIEYHERDLSEKSDFLK